MTTLKNDAPFEGLNNGTFVYKASGALDIQIQINDEGYDTVTDGVIGAAGTGIIKLPDCDIQITNAGAETLIISRTKD